MAILSVNFVILSALINQTFFINQSPGVSNVYMYLNYISNDSGQRHNLDYWLELKKSNLYGVPVFQGNLSNVVLLMRKTDKRCGPDVLAYTLRLVYYGDKENYGDTPDINKIILPGSNNYRCNITKSSVKVDDKDDNNDTITTQSTDAIIGETEGNMNFTNTTNCNKVFNCTIRNILLLSISFNSVFVGIVYLMFKVFLYIYNKYK